MLSTTTWIVILIAALLLKYVILLPNKDREIYKLYAQRDKLALMAMSEELDQETEEYIFTIKYINFWIYYTINDYDFSIVWNNIVSIDYNFHKKIGNVRKNIAFSEPLAEAMSMAEKQGERALGLSGIVFEKVFLNGVIFVLNLALHSVELGIGISKLTKKLSTKLNYYLNDSKRIKRGYQDFSGQMTYKW